MGESLLDQVSTSEETEVVEEIGTAVDGLSIATAQLTALLETVPDQAVPGIATALAAIASAGGDELEKLSVVAARDELNPEADAALEAVIVQLTATVEMIVTQLEAILPLLPPEAQGPVQAAIDTVEGVLTGVVTMLDGIFDGLPGAPDLGGGPPFPIPAPGPVS